jgi:cyclophilin family peptidyl-prolyl cis-trans isomerase
MVVTDPAPVHQACGLAGHVERGPHDKRREGKAMSRFALVTVVVALGLAGAVSAAAKGNPMVLLSTSQGDIKIELYPDKAPVTVKNFLEYVKAGYYDGTVFHRVIPGFMIQGGGLTADMQDKREGQKPPIKNESDNGLKNEVGTLAMARTSAPDSATSQFFINVKDNTFLNRESAADKVGYAVFGKVVEGMDVVKKIEQVKTASKGPHQNVPVETVVIKSAKVVSE